MPQKYRWLTALAVSLLLLFSNQSIAEVSPPEDPTRLIQAQTSISLDVSQDGQVTPLDVLTIINYINANGSGAVFPDSEHLDVNKDGMVTPLDVLAVVNYLNNPQAIGLLELNLTGPDTACSEVSFSWSAVDSNQVLVNFRWRLQKPNNSFTDWQTQAQSQVTLDNDISTQGQYVLELQAQYSRGYWSGILRHSFSIDCTPPNEPVINPVEAYTYESSIVLSGSKQAKTSIWINEEEKVSLDDSISWSYEFNLSLGENILNIKAQDVVGNQSAPATITITRLETLKSEDEPNNTLSQATLIPLDAVVLGTINPLGDEDYFKYQIEEPGLLVMELSEFSDKMASFMKLFNADGGLIASGVSWSAPLSLEKELTSGDYCLRVAPRNDQEMSLRPYRLKSNFYTLWFSNFSFEPKQFSPNGDGIRDSVTIAARVNRQVAWSIEIWNSSQQLIRSLSGRDRVISAVWDGKDDNGILVPDGRYTFAMKGRDPDSGIELQQKQGTLVVDNHFVTLTEPAPGSILSGIVTLRAVASEYISRMQFLQFFCYLPGVANPAGLGTFSQEPDGSWTAEWDTSTVNNGDCEVELHGSYYNLDNLYMGGRTLPVNYIIDNPIVIDNLSETSDAFSPNNNGLYDTTTLSYFINQAGRVTIGIYTEDNVLVRTLKSNVLETSGSNTVVWDGRDDSGSILPDDTYVYKIDAVTSLGSQAEQKQGQVSIDNHFLTLIEPAPGSTLTGIVRLRVMPSEHVHNTKAPSFGYCTPGTKNCVWVLGFNRWSSDGSYVIDWDSSVASNGNYDIRFSLSYYDINGQYRGETTFPVSYTINNPLLIDNLSAVRNAFSPNNDGQHDTTTISYLINQPASVTVKIYDSNDTLIRILKDNASETSGINTAVWDGKDDQGNVLPEGTYTYKVNGSDSLGNPAEQKQGQVSIDNHFMTIIEPAANSTLTGTVTLKVALSQYTQGLKNVRFHYRVPGELNWIPVNGWFNHQGDSVFVGNWDTATVNNGNYELRFGANYNDVNGKGRLEDISPISCTVDNPLLIDNLSAVRNAFSPNNDGKYDTTTISYSINRPASVTLRLYDENDALIRTLKDNVRESSGTNTAVWDGKDDQGNVVPEGTYTYEIDASDSFGNPAEQKQGQVSIDNHPLTLTEPAPDSTLTGTVTLRLILSQYTQGLSAISINYRTPGTTNWKTAHGWFDHQLDGSFVIDWNTTTVNNGNYEIRLAVIYYDLNGKGRNESTPAINCVVENIAQASAQAKGTAISHFIATLISDNKSMTITEPEPENTLSGIVSLKVEPSEDIPSLHDVYFYYQYKHTTDWWQISKEAVKQSDDTWTVDWDTSEVNNGDYELRAKAYYYNLNKQGIVMLDTSPVEYRIINGSEKIDD